jgi:Transglycosylase-like domain
MSASVAQAHLVSKSKPKKHTLKHIAKSQEQNLSHSRYVCREGRLRIRSWHCASKIWLNRELKQTKKKLAPSPVAIISLGPLSCISCWDRVAYCESTGNWSYNGSSGFDGGLQFLPSTWVSYGGSKYAPYAYMATKLQQISIASFMALSHWPVCGARY